jgi:assimilatory nitrate reductase catalytic subunit
VAVRSRGNLVCTCLNVTDLEIAEQLARTDGDDSARLAALQSELRCGTACGSCVPQLKRLIRSAETV